MTCSHSTQSAQVMGAAALRIMEMVLISCLNIVGLSYGTSMYPRICSHDENENIKTSLRNTRVQVIMEILNNKMNRSKQKSEMVRFFVVL